MGKVQYSPKAFEDLQCIKGHISQNYGENVAKKILKTITTNVKSLERFPALGVDLTRIIEIPTEYHYLFVEKNYVFYRLEEKIIKVIRILNEQQGYMEILFGISIVSEEENEIDS